MPEVSFVANNDEEKERMTFLDLVLPQEAPVIIALKLYFAGSPLSSQPLFMILLLSEIGAWAILFHMHVKLKEICMKQQIVG